MKWSPLIHSEFIRKNVIAAWYHERGVIVTPDLYKTLFVMMHLLPAKSHPFLVAHKFSGGGAFRIEQLLLLGE
jgi:hypothetical protein